MLLRTFAVSLAIFATISSPAATAPDNDRARKEFLAQSPPHDQPLPRFDVDVYCRAVAEKAVSDPPRGYQHCFVTQQTHYDQLKPVWPRIPKDIVQKCLGTDAPAPTSDYLVLNVCVNANLDERIRRMQPFPKLDFKY